MASVQTIFVCSNCGEEYVKWQGKCANCGEWNTLKEFHSAKNLRQENIRLSDLKSLNINEIKISGTKRIKTEIEEFNRAVGGGIVSGSIMIIGGDPGIGKSTLLLQLAANLDNVLYVSGEESHEQIKIRFDRLNLKAKGLKLLAETSLDRIIEIIKNEKPEIVIIDSIQTVYTDDFPSTPGSLIQVKECAFKFQQLAKTTKTPVILVGHVTKDGTVAGPRTLEHLVDVVLYLEGERFGQHRILRSVKNRFGDTSEIGIFDMTEKGLIEVANPSKLFLAEHVSDIPGAVVAGVVEGSRALLVEVQALTAVTNFGYPQRRASGFDLNRSQLLIAVLQKRAGINLASQDVFVNMVGGIEAREPAADLAVALAIVSSFKNKPLDSKLCAFGEIGLSGEIRQVSHESKRQAEAKRLGFTKFINAKTINEAIRRYFV